MTSIRSKVFFAPRALIAALLALMLHANYAHAQSEKARVICFPSQGLGQYWITSGTDPFMLIWPITEKSYPAKGKALVPTSAFVKLATGWGNGSNISLLSRLRPDDVQSLDLSGSILTDENLKNTYHLSGLKELELVGESITTKQLFSLGNNLSNVQSADLGFAKIGDKDLDSLSGFSHLLRLSLRKTKITDAGISKLLPLSHLTDLDISANSITDVSLPVLKNFKTLTTLNLSNTKVTAGGIAQLTRIRRLDISETNIDDSGLKTIVGAMPLLEELNLSHTKVTDAGIKELKNVRNLHKIWLRGVKTITIASVPPLSNCAKLKDIEVQGTNITLKGVNELGASLPQCEVHSKQPCHCHKRTRIN